MRPRQPICADEKHSSKLERTSRGRRLREDTVARMGSRLLSPAREVNGHYDHLLAREKPRHAKSRAISGSGQAISTK